MPACWKDLLKPEYKGMVGYLDPTSAAVGYVGAVAVNHALGGSDQDFTPAIKFFKDLQKNEPIVPKQTSYARVVSGEIPILFDYDFNAYRAKYTEKGNFDFVIPCEGTVVFPYVVSLVKNAPDKAKGEEGARLSAVGQGSGDLDQRLSAPGAADRAAAPRSSPSSCPTATTRAPRASTGRRWKRCKRASPTATSPKCAEASRRSGSPGAPAHLSMSVEHAFVPSRSACCRLRSWRSHSSCCRWSLAVIVGASGELGLGAYAAILTEPRYRATLINTVVLAAATTVATLVDLDRRRPVPAAPPLSRPRRFWSPC